MPTYTRKEFLGLGAVLAGSACAGLPGTESQDTPGDDGARPDLIVVNAHVFTVDDGERVTDLCFQGFCNDLVIDCEVVCHTGHARIADSDES